MKRKKRVKTKKQVKRVAKTPIIVKASLVFLVFFVLIATVLKVTEFFIDKNTSFPKLEIFLKDVAIEGLDAGTKNIKYPGNALAVTISGNTTAYDNIEVKGRGNYTWGQLKKPYQIKFSEKTNLFNRGATKKWVLLADYLDQTHLRNDIAFYLADILDENYTYQGNPIELYIDDNYRGLYYLVKKISTNEAGLNLKSTDGIIVELDNLYGKLDGCTYDEKNNCFITKDIVNETYTETAIKDLVYSMNLLYKAIENQDYTSITKIIDIDSFVKYFLLSEFTVNPDAYSSSFYMYKDGKEDKVHAGPIWDFDMALGNKYWKNNNMDSETIHSPFETMVFKQYLSTLNSSDIQYASTLLYNLMDIPEFKTRVKEIYQQTLSDKKNELLDYIKSQADYIRPAALHDQERWKLKTNFDDEVDYLIDWVTKRYQHFKETYGPNSPSSTTTNPDQIQDQSPNLTPESPQPEPEHSVPQD